MTKIYSSLTQLVGRTPMMQFSRLSSLQGIKAQVIGKLEYFNPAGSIKDRVALSMVESLEESGAIRPGATLIEPTSGNTGIGLAFVSASRGYKLILTMPESMSMERRKLLAALGAELYLTEASKGMSGAIAKAEELQKEIAGSVILNQFGNAANPAAHYKTTAEEIWQDTEGKVDIVVAGVGTGGTISGIGARLKELNPQIEMIAVEPSDSAVLSGKSGGAHKIQGIGAGFIPANYNAEVVDRIIAVDYADAQHMARMVATSEGLLIGVSSAAALHAAMSVAAEPQNINKQIVVILPDSGERYLSTELFEINDDE
ncbi:MAG: cysteine synthase A [Rikenellaceae bacterium]